MRLTTVNTLFASVLYVTTGCASDPAEKKADEFPVIPAVPVMNYSVTDYLPHDTSLFTEGLLVHDGKLFESTGSPEDLPSAKSLIGYTDLSTFKFVPKIELDKTKYFGEGIVFLHGRLYQLTYRTSIGFVYDAGTFKQVGSFSFENKEGWGLTTDGYFIIMSDGTDRLTYLDPQTMKPVKTLSVTANGTPRDNLNELEFIKGYIYANIWKGNEIVKIDPVSGAVIGILDLSSLMEEARSFDPKVDVMNGIAYDSTSGKVYVTGKLWPKIYGISFAK